MKLEDIDKKLQAITENGQHLSPILPEGIKNYLIDDEFKFKSGIIFKTNSLNKVAFKLKINS